MHRPLLHHWWARKQWEKGLWGGFEWRWVIFPVFQVFWLKPAIVDRIFGAVVVVERVVDSVEAKDGV